jgi:hypothetical protein
LNSKDRNVRELPPETMTGGCQCGSVRFRIDGSLGRAAICHCRMCQKAFGHFYAPLVAIGGARFTWTRGQPHTFASSNQVSRGFCGQCGTPLFYDAPDGIALAIGAFDDPASVVPEIQFGSEAKLPYTDSLVSLPLRHTLDDASEAPYLNQIVSCQHPDCETETWPPA